VHSRRRGALQSGLFCSCVADCCGRVGFLIDMACLRAPMQQRFLIAAMRGVVREAAFVQ